MNPLSPEELRSNGEAMIAASNGKAVQHKCRDCIPNAEHYWAGCVPEINWNVMQLVYRPAPEPEPPKPWDFNTRPKEMIWVYKKGYISDRLITAWCDDGVEIGNYAKITYEVLLREWLQRDGSPCGIVNA